MSGFRRCDGCKRRLTNVLFCSQCGGWFCCPGCLARDNDRHLHAKTAPVSTASTSGGDAGRSERRTVMLSVVSTSR